jgi:hypothetical protein
MSIAPDITFDSAEREYNHAWNAPSSTRFELPPVDVNEILKERYRVSPDQTLTRAMIWDMETKKAWDPLTYIPYVVSQGGSWGRTALSDGSTRFCRSSLQRGWITPEEGLVLEEVLSAMPSGLSISWDGHGWLKKAARLSWRAPSSPSFMSDTL